MNNITNETITLDEIWTVINEANKDGEYPLSGNDEEKIIAILERYAEAANVANTRTEPVLPLQRANRWAYLYDNWSAIMLGFGIAISFSILLNMIENIIVKIALIIHGG